MPTGSGRLFLPSYRQGFARNASVSDRPQDWRGLVGLWLPQLGPTGSTLRDWSGHGYHGTLTNMAPATDWVVTSEGHALDIDGVDGEIIVTTPDALAVSYVSLYVWAESENLGIVDGLNNNMVQKKDFNNNDIYGFYQDQNSDNITWTYRLSASPTIARESPANAAVTSGIHAYVGTFDGTIGRFYIDAIRQTADDTQAGTIETANPRNFFIGNHAISKDLGWDGPIWQVRVYSHAHPHSMIREIIADPLGIVRQKRDSMGLVPAVATVGHHRLGWGRGFMGQR